MSRMMARELGGGLGREVVALVVDLKCSWRRVFTYSAGYYMVSREFVLESFLYACSSHVRMTAQVRPTCLYVCVWNVRVSECE